MKAERPADPTKPARGRDCEPDPRERLLKSDLSFEDLTRSILNKKPPPGGWNGQHGEGDGPER